MEQVILVDENDCQVGVMEKLAAHQNGGFLHRAISVFVFNSNGEMLLQQRNPKKYHSGGLWTNTCCSHPRPGEETQNAATRRLQEEMGFYTKLFPAFTFTYKAEFDNGLTEFELDYVFIGNYDGEVKPNTNEVSDYKYVAYNKISDSVSTNPDQFTEWFKIALPKVKAYMQEKNITD